MRNTDECLDAADPGTKVDVYNSFVQITKSILVKQDLQCTVEYWEGVCGAYVLGLCIVVQSRVQLYRYIWGYFFCLFYNGIGSCSTIAQFILLRWHISPRNINEMASWSPLHYTYFFELDFIILDSRSLQGNTLKIELESCIHFCKRYWIQPRYIKYNCLWRVSDIRTKSNPLERFMTLPDRVSSMFILKWQWA